MRSEVKEKYIILVEFLGLVLGPSYEIALHDLSLKDKSIIAIANGHITGRTIGAPVPGSMKNLLNTPRKPDDKYRVNYTALAADKKQLRSSTLYIKDGGRTVGLLCITFDDTKFRSISKQILGLCHPDQLLVENTFEKAETLKIEDGPDIYQTEVGQLLPTMFDSVMRELHIAGDKLKRKEKLRIVSEMKERGAFLVKGAAEEVAGLLGISAPTIYRLLKEIKDEES